MTYSCESLVTAGTMGTVRPRGHIWGSGAGCQGEKGAAERSSPRGKLDVERGIGLVGRYTPRTASVYDTHLLFGVYGLMHFHDDLCT